MTSGESEPRRLERVSQQDIDAVAERLKEWVPTLPEQEQLVLGWILARAAGAEQGEVQGYAQYSRLPVSGLLAQATGLGFRRPSPAATIGPVTVWTYRFGAVQRPGEIRQ